MRKIGKLQFLVLAIVMLVFWSCEQSADKDARTNGADSEDVTNDDSGMKEEQKDAEIEVSPKAYTVKVLKTEKPSEEDAGKQDVRIDLGKGYSLSEKGIWFSGVEWLTSKLQVLKDGEEVFTWENEKYGRDIVIRNPKFDQEHPRLLTKGEKAIILFDIVIPPNGMDVDAVAIENGKFVKVMKGVKVNLEDKSALEDLFKEAF